MVGEVILVSIRKYKRVYFWLYSVFVCLFGLVCDNENKKLVSLAFAEDSLGGRTDGSCIFRQLYFSQLREVQIRFQMFSLLKNFIPKLQSH